MGENTKAEARAARLKAALRANLRRRKEQARARNGEAAANDRAEPADRSAE